ncbi:hypothetical protein HDU67_009032 [Dinochytrium kinnereticum]|nr:hypothetical protein HDU67_009032 [Dinochytrium kinnereticum]
MAILLGVGGVLSKIRPLAWLALFSAIVSFVSTKGSEREFRQGAGSLSFTVMGIFLLYINLIMPKLQQPAA